MRVCFNAALRRAGHDEQGSAGLHKPRAAGACDCTGPGSCLGMHGTLYSLLILM